MTAPLNPDRFIIAISYNLALCTRNSEKKFSLQSSIPKVQFPELWLCAFRLYSADLSAWQTLVGANSLWDAVRLVRKAL